VHEIALVDDQVTYEILPGVTLVGRTEKTTVGSAPPELVGVDGGVDPDPDPDAVPELDPVPDPDADPEPNAEQLAVVPPLEPPQLHVHGPEPATDDDVPVEQRLVEGADDACMPFADPHAPLTAAAAAAFTATVVLAIGDAPPAPVQVSV
jgi:hypothetical protein